LEVKVEEVEGEEMVVQLVQIHFGTERKEGTILKKIFGFNFFKLHLLYADPSLYPLGYAVRMPRHRCQLLFDQTAPFALPKLTFDFTMIGLPRFDIPIPISISSIWLKGNKELRTRRHLHIHGWHDRFRVRVATRRDDCDPCIFQDKICAPTRKRWKFLEVWAVDNSDTLTVIIEGLDALQRETVCDFKFGHEFRNGANGMSCYTATNVETSQAPIIAETHPLDSHDTTDVSDEAILWKNWKIGEIEASKCQRVIMTSTNSLSLTPLHHCPLSQV